MRQVSQYHKFYSLSELPEEVRNEVLDAGPTVHGGTLFCRQDGCVYSWRKIG